MTEKLSKQISEITEHLFDADSIISIIRESAQSALADGSEHMRSPRSISTER